ncbi:hypothetical protein ACS8E3_12850 [Psychrobacter sp. 2Y5]|uniref:hypothetical protein n=1 Tax=unclassified Psychrobacter TaxID=196806 RepID=UPI003F470F9A
MTPPNPTPELHNQLTLWLDSYLQVQKAPADEQSAHNKKSTTQQLYQLPLGQLRVLRVVLAPLVDNTKNNTKTDIDAIRSAAIRFALRWKKRLLKQDKNNQINSAYVLILERRPAVDSDNLVQTPDDSHRLSAEMTSADTQHAIEYQSADANDSGIGLQVFDQQVWQMVLDTLQTPNDLWRLLRYHQAELQQSLSSTQLSSTQIDSTKPSFNFELSVLNQFMDSPAIYAQALTIDNALIKYGIQDAPNNTLVAMSLAQRNNEKTTKRIYEQMRQTSLLWHQLSAQMLSESLTAAQLPLWQRQLLSESLFSRHELIRTLYQHPSRSIEQQQAGYVVHQHSYESLGRHYVLIFYGRQQDGKQSRKTIAPNLATIAKDVSTRLPIAELHHVIVLGVEFMVEGVDTFIDIDLFIQPVTAMSEKERQLTRQLQRLNSQQHNQKHDGKANKVGLNKNSKPLPTITLSFNIPATKNKPQS